MSSKCCERCVAIGDYIYGANGARNIAGLNKFSAGGVNLFLMLIQQGKRIHTLRRWLFWIICRYHNQSLNGAGGYAFATLRAVGVVYVRKKVGGMHRIECRESALGY